MGFRDEITGIVMHCTATPADWDFVDRDWVDAAHKALGWSGIGYHFLVKRDGTVEQGRSTYIKGAHCEAEDRNADSLGIVYAGGLELLPWVKERYPEQSKASYWRNWRLSGRSPQDAFKFLYPGNYSRENPWRLKDVDNRTGAQYAAMERLCRKLRVDLGRPLVLTGHNDHTDEKACPCFNVAEKHPALKQELASWNYELPSVERDPIWSGRPFDGKYRPSFLREWMEAGMAGAQEICRTDDTDVWGQRF